jgi:hypothetical protein
MLKFLGARATGSRLRLFACACCRRAAHLFDDRVSLEAVLAAEQFAVGGLGERRLAQAHRAAQEAAQPPYYDWDYGWRYSGSSPAQGRAAEAAAAAAAPALTAQTPTPWVRVVEALGSEARQALEGGMSVRQRRRRWPFLPERPEPSREAAERLVQERAQREQCGLLREVFGNPFRPSTLDPAWLRWNGGWLRRAAWSIFHDSRFAELPVLADALEEAGCTDEALLRHCREPGEHVRGCWALGLLLGLK